MAYLVVGVTNSILIDLLIKGCYFSFMSNDLQEKLAANLKRGGVVAAIITLLVSLFIIFLYRFSFICLDPELCARADKPLIIHQQKKSR